MLGEDSGEKLEVQASVVFLERLRVPVWGLVTLWSRHWLAEHGI